MRHRRTEDHRGHTEKHFRTILAIVLFAVISTMADAQPRITIAHNDNKTANAEFKFANVPSPARDDAATNARVVIVDGEADPNGADVTALVDGLLPSSGNQPRRNFFVTAGSGGARLLMDLGKLIQVAAVNSYSWHPNSRAPQVYRIWASDGADHNFNAEPKANLDPRACGWKLIATVDTRSADEDKDGGQFGVTITDARGSLGKFRYLLFDCYVTEVADNFGNTFYSEIDVIAKK
ncbi:MAG TPA: hypothetical protein VGJ69_15170 [Pyrinomonadaceae bacterium]